MSVLLGMLLTVLPAASQEESGGLWYTALSDSTAEIVRNQNGMPTGDLVIPEYIDGLTVVSIGTNAFWNSDITSVTLPKTIREIALGAFRDCDQLMTVAIDNPTPPFANYNAFSPLTTKLGRLLVPAGSRKAYQNDPVGHWGPAFWHVYDNGGEREYHTLSMALIQESGNRNLATYEVNGLTVQTFDFEEDFEEDMPLTIKFTPSKDYEFSRMLVNGEDVTGEVTDNTFHLPAMTENTTIEVMVRKIPSQLKISQAVGGSIAVIADDDIKSYQMRVVPDEGYAVSQLLEGGKNLLPYDLRQEFDRSIGKKGSYTIRYKKD